LYRAACREFASRPDKLVEPSDPDALFVEVVLRENWPRNQFMLEPAIDVGFLRIDVDRQVLLFEGDKERYIVPAASILSCEVEQMQTATYVVAGQPRTRTDPRYAAVLRANRFDGPWEAALAVRYDAGGPFVFVGTSHHARAHKLKDTILRVLSTDGNVS
jgi:hypothetical protein